MRNKNPLGCLTWPAILATVVTFLAITGTVVSAGQSLFSPGPLNAQSGAPLGNVSSHAQISGACEQCHVAPWQADSMQNRCLRCHADLRLELSDSHKLHGILLGQQAALACGKCHPEHRGPNASLTEVTLNNFPHERLGFATTSHRKTAAGTAFTCQTCHVTGYKDFKTSACADCHLQVDRAFMVAHLSAYTADCRACHDGQESIDRHFEHPKAVFPLVGVHPQVACAKCHAGTRRLADFKALPTQCAACHLKDNPHGEKLGTACETCHNQQSWQAAQFEHAVTGFPLSGRHARVACEKCHPASSQFKNTPTACVGCHQKDDRHAGSEGPLCETCHTPDDWKASTFNHDSVFKLVGAHTGATCDQCHSPSLQFKNAPTDCFGCHKKDDQHAGSEGTACETCHTLSSWKPTTFNHDNAVFKLTGAHPKAACSKCHTVPGLFKGTPTACVACHLKNDAHKGSLGTGCSSCHATAAWKPSTFNHNQTAFRLTGSHASVQCAGCHLNGAFKGTPTTCFGCHQRDDKHAGGEGTACETCHTTTGWKPSTFNHGPVFALTGAHSNLACNQCHTTPFKFDHTPTTCFGCHQRQDFHAGTEGTACENCHTNSNWKPSTFNHTNAAFPLTGAHVNALCAKCHPAQGLFKGAPQTCYACHAANDPHGGAFGTGCEACHATAAWKPATFDHNRSAFPLTGAHQNQPCSACHKPGVFRGTPTACAGCHTEPAYHAGLFGTDCAACHATTNWSATYNGPHTFPRQHGGSNGACATCHPATLAQWTCFNCHNQAQITTQHAEKGITDLSNCLQCHPTGRKE
jgi:hypothetical protein